MKALDRLRRLRAAARGALELARVVPPVIAVAVVGNIIAIRMMHKLAPWLLEPPPRDEPGEVAPPDLGGRS